MIHTEMIQVIGKILESVAAGPNRVNLRMSEHTSRPRKLECSTEKEAMDD